MLMSDWLQNDLSNILLLYVSPYLTLDLNIILISKHYVLYICHRNMLEMELHYVYCSWRVWPTCHSPLQAFFVHVSMHPSRQLLWTRRHQLLQHPLPSQSHLPSKQDISLSYVYSTERCRLSCRPWTVQGTYWDQYFTLKVILPWRWSRMDSLRWQIDHSLRSTGTVCVNMIWFSSHLHLGWISLLSIITEGINL